MISEAALKAMLAAGCTAEQIVAAVLADRGGRSSAAKRQAKYRESLKAREAAEKSGPVNVTNESDVTLRNGDAQDVTERHTVTTVSLSPVPLLSPTPPNNPLTPNPIQKTNKRGHRLPADWTMSGPDLAYALSKGLSEREAGSLFERFCSWAWSASGPNAVKINWHQAWQGWVQRDATKIIAARAGPTGKPLTAFQQRRQETKDILDDLDNFARSGSSGSEAHIGLLPGHPRQ